MPISYLGKLSQGDQKTTYFWDAGSDVVVQATACDNGSRIQAYKRLILAEGHLKKGIQLDQLQTLLSAYNAGLEIVSSAPDGEWVTKLEPLKDRKRSLLEANLDKVERELTACENEFLEWKGVRDLDEAHENFKNRSYEIRDLNQKLYHIDREPQLIYNPGHPLKTQLSAWQTIGRFHLRELKDQAKERTSALRLRIDFTKRQRIKILKDKRKELLGELEDERKREKDHAKTIASLVDETAAVTLALTIRGPVVQVRGPKDVVVRKCAEELAEIATRLARTLREKLGLTFVNGPASWIRSVGVASHERALLHRETLIEEVAKVATAILGSSPPSSDVPDLRFPKFAPDRKLAYLGLATDEAQVPTAVPVLYDLDALARHVLVVGGTGSGKTQLARILVESLLLQHSPIPVLVIDPTGSWTGFMQPCGAQSMRDRYEAFGMKPDWARRFPTQALDPGCPVGELCKRILDFRGVSILLTNSLSADQENQVVNNLLGALQIEIQGWPEGSTRFAIVIDEAHKFLADKSLNNAAQYLARTARVKGAAMIFISQNWTDVGDIRSNCQTKAQLSTGYGPDLVRASQVFGSKYRTLVPKLKQGCAMVNYPEWGTALVQVRPSLSHPAGASLEAIEMLEAASRLREITATLLDNVATDDADDSQLGQESQNASTGSPTVETALVPAAVATNWRDVATRLARDGHRPLSILAALTNAGIRSPSVRTIQRLVRNRPAAPSENSTINPRPTKNA